MSATPNNIIAITARDLGALSAGIQLSEIRKAIPQLEAACRAKVEVSEAFSDLCKVVAARANISPSVLATYINCYVNETLDKRQRQIDQLSLLFEELK
jgi:hypothetical protein